MKGGCSAQNSFGGVLPSLRAHVHQLAEASTAAPRTPTAFPKDFQFANLTLQC
jgi:hypothetical protein